MALKDDAGFEHLPGLKAVQGADKAQGGGSELRRTVGNEGADAVTDLHDAHGGHVTDASAEAGAADFEGTGELAFRRYFVAWLKGSTLDQRPDVVNHLHRTMSIRLFFFRPRHKMSYPLAILKISVTGRLPPIAGVWLEKRSGGAKETAVRPAYGITVYTSGLTSHSGVSLVCRCARRLE